MEKIELLSALENVAFEISVCISEIPPHKMVKSSNGKVYCNLTVAKRKNPDQWGRTVKVSVTRTQQERQSGEGTKFVGSGRVQIFEKKKEITEEEVNALLKK